MIWEFPPIRSDNGQFIRCASKGNRKVNWRIRKLGGSQPYPGGSFGFSVGLVSVCTKPQQVKRFAGQKRRHAAPHQPKRAVAPKSPAVAQPPFVVVVQVPPLWWFGFGGTGDVNPWFLVMFNGRPPPNRQTTTPKKPSVRGKLEGRSPSMTSS